MDLKTKEKASVKVLINDKKRRRVRVGDPDFAPPDGGWGWLVVFACGFSNLSTFPMFQQFGLIFEEKFLSIGITQTQKTFITNLTSAFNAIVGLSNGPVYRKYTFRQVSMVFSLLVAGSLFACVFCSSFWAYVVCYCALYGSAFGFVQSANSLALNTYFKEKRRVATGLSWTTTALGPIVWPFIIVYLDGFYGMDGVLTIFSAFALHSFVCALLLQPVEWHTKFKRDELQEPLRTKPETAQGSGRLSRISSKIFSYQYFGNEDDPVRTGYEIVDPGTPMMLRSNDGWYSQGRSQVGSRMSLASNKGTTTAGPSSAVPSKRASVINLSEHGREREHRKKGKSKKISVTQHEGHTIREEAEESNDASTLRIPNEKEVLKSAAKKLAVYEQEQHVEAERRRLVKQPEPEPEPLPEPVPEPTAWQKFIIFFDFDLLKDLVYVNLMVGITVANFAELNFSILTPIIMSEFGFTKYQIATFMSLLAATDIVIRFFVPFAADRIGWSNRVFFMVGVLSMALGRIVLIHIKTYPVALAVSVVIGAGKALRTIFMALVIPSHVPLEKLPAASGLQLAFCGISYIMMGPCVGWIRDTVGDYGITLHLLNICTYATIVSWAIEMVITKRKKQKEAMFKNGIKK